MIAPRRSLLAPLALVACMGLTACGDPSPDVVALDAATTSTRPPPRRTSTTIAASTTSTTLAPTTTAAPAPPPPPGPPPTVPPTWPPYEPLPGVTGYAALTGLPLDDATAAHPAIAVKIDNARAARGQWGLDAADVVFEENVEGLTRFIAVFHSHPPAEAGPVRSARTGDLRILSGMNRPVLAWSGGNPGVTAWVRAAASAGAIVDLSALRSPCYRRDPSRKAPHNLVVNLGCALTSAPTAGAARPLWTFLAEGEVPAGAPIGAFEVAMDGVRVGWTWDAASSRYVRSQDGRPHLSAAGAPITATNVVVASIPHQPSAVDARTPEPQTVGQGRVTVHTGGVARTGTWSRADITSPWTFTDDAGNPIALAPGTTFVELTRA